MKKTLSKMTAAVLLICMTFSVFSIYNLSWFGDESIVGTDILSGAELPDVISPEEAVENGYIGRLHDEEKDFLNRLVFQNADGKKTLRVFNHPVKYVDENGDIRDISLEIAEKTGGGFKTAANSVVTEFSAKLSGGVTLTHDEVNIKMVPYNTGLTIPTASLSTDKKTVRYQMTDKTAYDYSLTYTGFKEDIVVSEYTGQTAFMFNLYTGGLTLDYEDGRYVLADGSGQVKAEMSDIIIFTADERNNGYGSMSYKTVRANEEYRITINVDGEYLKDENTKYPIKIDPTISITYEESGEEAIEDVIIKENATYTGSFGSLYIGRHSDGYLSRVLMRFPGLALGDIAFYYNIEEATVEIRDLMCQGDEAMYIECYSYTGATWSEASTPTWSSVGSDYVGELLDSHLITYANGNVYNEEITVRSQRYSYDITELAKDWMTGESSPEKGIVFKATSEFEGQTGGEVQNWKKTFSSYEREVHKPSLKIVYTSSIRLDYYSLNINEGSSYTMGVTTNPQNQTVTWTSSNTTAATVDQNGVITGNKAGTAVITASYVDEDGVTVSASCTVYVTVPDGVYWIRNISSWYYLNVQDRSIQNITATEQRSKYDSEESQISQMWRITHVSEEYYTIRPYHKVDMGLFNYLNKACINYIGTADNMSLSSMYLWTIRWDGYGYIFEQDDTGYALQVKDASQEEGAEVILSTYTASGRSRWNLISVSDVPTGITLYDTASGKPLKIPNKYIAEGDTKTLSNLDIKAILYANYSPQVVEIYQRTIGWSSNKTESAVVSSDGTIEAISSDIVTVTASFTTNAVSVSASYIAVVYSQDDVQYLKMTRDVTEQYTLCIATLYNGDKYWYQIGDDGTVSDVLLLSEDNINLLNDPYSVFDESEDNPFGIIYCINQAKYKLDNAISNNQLYNVEEGSDEYYGLWLYFSLLEEQYREAILLFLEGCNIVMKFVDIYHCGLVLANNISILANSSYILTHVQYESGLAVSKICDTIDDVQAVSDGITDVTVYTGKRPTWRESEAYAGARRFTTAAGYVFNKSFKINDKGEFDDAYYGEAGSVRPDYYNRLANHCVDIKNYTITTESGVNNLVNNVTKQYNQRKAIFPEGTIFEVCIDVRGQEYDQNTLDNITSRISEATQNGMIVTFIKN